MSGMKFRRTCSLCNATFFSPDRKASLCLKCSKKKVVKHVPVVAGSQPVRVAPRPVPRVAPVSTDRKKGPRPPKSGALTPEIRQKVVEMFEGEYSGRDVRMKEVHSSIAEKLWVKRQVVADVLRDLQHSRNNLTADLRERAVAMYQRFVESGHRPEGGRRRAISLALGVPYKQVMGLIREWSLAEYAKSPTPSPSRQQLFEIEKTYWSELNQQRYRLTEMPALIAEDLGYVTRWQVLRWLDVLHDDERSFLNVPDPAGEIKEQIVQAYLSYLAKNSPPDHGLHYTVAREIGKVTPRQVHKVLQSYRHKKRADYPLL